MPQYRRNVASAECRTVVEQIAASAVNLGEDAHPAQPGEPQLVAQPAANAVTDATAPREVLLEDLQEQVQELDERLTSLEERVAELKVDDEDGEGEKEHA